MSEAPSRSVALALLSVSDLHSEEDDPSGHLARSLLEAAGHRIVHRGLVANSVADVRDWLDPRLAEIPVEAAVTVGGTGVSSRDMTVPALEAMGGKLVGGFGELYRSLSFEEVGAVALFSRAGLYLVRGKPVFALPGSERAVRTSLDRLIVPALGTLLDELER